MAVRVCTKNESDQHILTHTCTPMVITAVLVGPSPAEMSLETAFRIFPIVHQYGMQLMVGCCETAFERSKLDLWPSDPMASSEVPDHPGLVQCLALADAKQCDSMVQSCLSQLIKPGSVSSHDTVFDALASPHLDTLIDGLRSDTKSKIIRRMAGLPEGYKVGPDRRYDIDVHMQQIWLKLNLNFS